MTLLNEYLKSTFGCKVYKIALNGGFTCPNRDGTLDSRGCIFCSAGGSGEFAGNPTESITEQIEAGKQKVSAKIKDGKYIAYFQAYTGTYAPVERLEKLYREAIGHPDIAALSIATRPDCLPDDVLDLLADLNKEKPVWVELGLQTIHEQTARYILRGYPLNIYDEAVDNLRKRNIEVITHVILGLPGEGEEDMLDTIRYVCGLPVGSKYVPHALHATGIKLQLLHILKGTDLEKNYREGLVTPLSEDEYINLLKKCTALIPDDVVIHRLTGDGDKKLLIAPLWSADKKHVWNRIQREVLSRD
ncbi:MAG: TIGR01212 family radical SAM protein [Lachnospiraceae bacterium]|nr:TIGR01212 family radical SAM protein [Lachnospiraceae bacterium]